ncbi:MAG: hypothetical protein Kow00114_33560 [Kiloniellaceae bacterium]
MTNSSKHPPFEDDPVAFEFYSLIGRILVCWSRIERSLDVAVAATRHLRDPKERSITSLQRKIKILEQTYRDNPHLAQGHPWASGALDSLGAAANFRHTLVHGYCHGIKHNAEPAIHFRKARYEPEGPKSQEIHATRADLWDYVLKLREIDYRMGMVAVHATIEARKGRLEPSQPDPRGKV